VGQQWFHGETRQDRQDCADDQHRLAPVAITGQGRQWRRQAHEQHREAQQAEERLAAVAQGGHAVAQGKRRGDVEQRITHHHRCGAQQYWQPMLAEQLHQRHFDWRFFGHGIGEHRGLVQFEARIQANHHQRSAEDERDTPAPAAELLVAQAHGQDQEQAVGRQEADRRAQLREHAEPGTFAFRCVLGRQQGCAAPFPAQAKALAETQHTQQDGGPGADAVIPRQQADQRGAHAHQQQRGHQCGFASDTVSKVAEQRRTQRAGDESDTEGQERCQHLRGAGGLREEHRANHQCSGSGIDIEVVELDGGADDARRGNPRGRVARCSGRRFVIGGAHEGIPGSQCAFGRGLLLVEHPWIRVVCGAARDGGGHRSDTVMRRLSAWSAGSTRTGGALVGRRDYRKGFGDTTRGTDAPQTKCVR